MAITKSDLLMGRDKIYPKEYTKEVSDNLDKLLEVIGKVEEKYLLDGGEVFKVNSGWRPSGINDATSNASKTSKHLLGLAVDIGDSEGKVWKWVLQNVEFLKGLGIYLEDKRWTPSWCHMQCVPPGSGKFIFIPSTSPALDPKAWDGKI